MFVDGSRQPFLNVFISTWPHLASRTEQIRERSDRIVDFIGSNRGSPRFAVVMAVIDAAPRATDVDGVVASKRTSILLSESLSYTLLLLLLRLTRTKLSEAYRPSS